MTTLCRMSHRRSEVTKKMAHAQPPPNALRINSLRVTAGSAAVEMRPAIGRVGPAVPFWGRKTDEGESVSVHVREGDKEKRW